MTSNRVKILLRVSSVTFIFGLVDFEGINSNESSGDVLGPDPVVPFRAWRVGSRPLGDDLHHVGLVDPVRHRVAELRHHFEDFRLEGVQGQGSNLGHVNAEAAVDPRAGDAERDAEIDRGPLRIGRPAVAAFVVTCEDTYS